MSIDWNWGIFLQQAPFGNTTYLGWIWSGFQVTIALSICAWIIAFLVGSFFGILRTVPNRFLSGLGTLYVELFRNVPGLSLSSSVHFSAFYVPFQTVFSPVWVRCMSNCSATCR